MINIQVFETANNNKHSLLTDKLKSSKSNAADGNYRGQNEEGSQLRKQRNIQCPSKEHTLSGNRYASVSVSTFCCKNSPVPCDSPTIQPPKAKYISKTSVAHVLGFWRLVWWSLQSILRCFFLILLLYQQTYNG